MIKKMTAATAAQIITFLWASRFPLIIRPQRMLVEMNRAVGRALKFDEPRPVQESAQRRCVVDLGCGAGATARTLVGDDPSLFAVTVTNVAARAP